MRKLVLLHTQAPGDAVMLTAAIRDLHLNYPRQFQTDVRSFHPDLWLNNPYLSKLSKTDSEIIECHYPLIHKSNFLPYHFIHGYIDYLNSQLDLQIKPTAFKGEVHLSDEEKNEPSQVNVITGNQNPFWLIVSGGKSDFTTKWWSAERYQQVVNYFKGKIQFVQVGEKAHYHPPLNNVIDLRGKTTLRQLLKLVYHSQGIVTPVSLLMHLAAAVENKSNPIALRPCVVIAGGREPAHWEEYPGHQFIHTIGALPCCATGGCWKSRTKQLGDGDVNDKPEKICVNVVNDLPHCLDMIKAKTVIERIEMYFERNELNYLN